MPEIITQKVQINGVPLDIFHELLVWSEAGWWPKGPMKITNQSANTDVGARYAYRVDIPFGPQWQAVNRIVDKQNLYLRRDFFEGDVDGFEEATIVADENGYCEVTYTFAAEVKGMVSKFFWNKAGKTLHQQNINMILRALKGHIEKRR